MVDNAKCPNALPTLLGDRASFRIQLYDWFNLLVTGSFDFAYYHQLEIEFKYEKENLQDSERIASWVKKSN